MAFKNTETHTAGLEMCGVAVAVAVRNWGQGCLSLGELSISHCTGVAWGGGEGTHVSLPSLTFSGMICSLVLLPLTSPSLWPLRPPKS